MSIKKIVLLVGLGVSVFTILLAVADEKFNLNCSYTTKEATYTKLWDPGRGMAPYYVSDRESVEWCEPLVFALVPFFPLLLLSLFTYFMKDEVFHAWWNFARWWVLVTIGVTLFVQNAGGGGGWGMNGGAFDAFFIGIFYFTFIAGSFSKIIHMYFRLRMEKMVGSEIKIKKFNEIFGWVDRIILVPITLLILLVLYSLSL